MGVRIEGEERLKKRVILSKITSLNGKFVRKTNEKRCAPLEITI